MLQAFIFDVDGTLADTEQAHLAAFNHAFAQEGLDWHWDSELYTELLNISGGKERMLHYWKQVQPDVKDIDGGGVQDTINRLHEIKTAAYETQSTGGCGIAPWRAAPHGRGTPRGHSVGHCHHHVAGEYCSVASHRDWHGLA